MKLNKFTIQGYNHFYRSLLRFCRDINETEALEITYKLYNAVIQSYRYKKPGVCIKELSEDDFYEKIKNTNKPTYRTIIQLYRAMETIVCNLVIKSLTNRQLFDISKLFFIMDDIELRFHKAYNMSITDERTIYYLCEGNLVFRRDEPGLCLLQDWQDYLATI